jgi:hypothetical protein
VESRRDLRPFTAVLLSGLLTGSELTSWGIVHPTLWKLDHQEQVHAERLMYRRFGTVDPFLQTATIAACFVAASGLRGRRSILGLLAGASYSAMLAITLIGNMPINLRVFRWDEQRERSRHLASTETALGPPPQRPHHARHGGVRADRTRGGEAGVTPEQSGSPLGSEPGE